MAGKPGRSGGHNKKPRIQKELEGTINITRDGPAPPPLPDEGTALMPPLSAPARKIWERSIAPRIALGWYSPADEALLGQFVELLVTAQMVNAKARRAARARDTDPKDLRSLISAASEISREVRALGSSFGLDVVARERIAPVVAATITPASSKPSALLDAAGAPPRHPRKGG